jgi:hypothetical protein
LALPRFLHDSWALLSGCQLSSCCQHLSCRQTSCHKISCCHSYCLIGLGWPGDPTAKFFQVGGIYLPRTAKYFLKGQNREILYTKRLEWNLAYTSLTFRCFRGGKCNLRSNICVGVNLLLSRSGFNSCYAGALQIRILNKFNNSFHPEASNSFT